MSQYLTEEEILKYCTSQVGVNISDVVIASHLIDSYLGKSFSVNEISETVNVSAKNRGVRFGRNFKLSEVEFRIIDQKIQSGEISISKACRDMKISRNCYYKTKERLELIAE